MSKDKEKKTSSTFQFTCAHHIATPMDFLSTDAAIETTLTAGIKYSLQLYDEVLSNVFLSLSLYPYRQSHYRVILILPKHRLEGVLDFALFIHCHL